MADDMINGEPSRRSMLKKGAVGLGAAWAAPTLYSTAASANGTTVFPNVVDNNNQRQVLTTSGSIVSVSLDGTNDAQVAAAFVPVDDATAGTTVNIAAGADWVLQINGVVSDNTGNRLKVFVWTRLQNLTNIVVFQLVGDAAAPWRAMGAEFTNVTAVGQSGATGGSGTTTMSAPAVTTPALSTAVAVWLGATLGDQTLFNVPSGYVPGTADYLNAPNLAAGYLFNVNPSTTVGPSSTTTPAVDENVGSHVLLLCQP